MKSIDARLNAAEKLLTAASDCPAVVIWVSTTPRPNSRCPRCGQVHAIIRVRDPYEETRR